MSKHTPGPWVANDRTVSFEGAGHRILAECGQSTYVRTDQANARLIAAAPDLLIEAQVLRCLATSPRFHGMTVSQALAEMKENGMGHDDGAAIAKVEGRE